MNHVDVRITYYSATNLPCAGTQRKNFSVGIDAGASDHEGGIGVLCFVLQWRGWLAKSYMI